MPTPIPALKIPAMTSHELKVVAMSNKIKAVSGFNFFISAINLFNVAENSSV